MVAKEYSELDLSKKIRLLWEFGTLLHVRTERSKIKVCIYEVDGFYVELSYGVEDNSIKKIEALENPTDWKGYLESIDLRKLMN